jgi:transcriptional regulator of arginine metabolism
MNEYTKQERQRILREILHQKEIGHQEQLMDELRKLNIATTQATISRDLREMGYVKVSASPGEFRYEKLQAPASREYLTRLRMLFEHFVTEIRGTTNMILVKTAPGNAHGVASHIDGLADPRILGTIAGDDTILLVVDSEENRDRVEKELHELL